MDGKQKWGSSPFGETNNDIIDRYNSLARGYLNYSSCAENLTTIRGLIKGPLRQGCYMQLAFLNNASPRTIVKRYGRDLGSKTRQHFYIGDREMNPIPRGFYPRRTQCSKEVNSWLQHRRPLDSSVILPVNRCAVIGCQNKATEVHTSRFLKDFYALFKDLIVFKDEKYFESLYAMQRVQWRKSLPFCSEHHRDLHNGNLHILDLRLPAVDDKDVQLLTL